MRDNLWHFMEQPGQSGDPDGEEDEEEEEDDEGWGDDMEEVD